MIPRFPDNIVVFPNRDMVVLEDGFGGDQPVLVEVKRNGQLMGAVGGTTVTGGAWEVNHPGGPCWGDGTTVNRTDLPQVTPDIRPGDVVSVRNTAGQLLADTIVQDGYVTENSAPVMNATGTGFTVTGHADPAIPDDQMEQRIINPDLTDTGVGRRDIRAVLSPGMEPAPKGGYSSRLEVDNAAGTFTATYDFTMGGQIAEATAQSVAAIAARSGGERLMSWEVADAGGNRQGLTIAQDDEFNGPGVPGCPSGPDGATPSAGSFAVTRDGDTARVTWTPATSQPGAAGVSGYSVEAVATSASANGERAVVGARTSATATSTTLTLPGGAANYDVEVRAMTGTTLSAPFPPASGTATPPPPTGGTADTTAPTISASQDAATGAVTLTASEPNVDMYYTTDGTTSPLDATADLPAQTATLYTGPIAISAATTLQWVGFDLAGNSSSVGSASFQPAAAPTAVAPNPPGVLRTTPGNGSVSLSWQAGADNGSPITGYTVTTLNAVGTGVGTPQSVPGTTATVSGLTNGTEYTFQVTATNSAGTSGAAEIKATPGDEVTVTLVRNRPRDVRIAGTSSQLGAQITLTLISPNGLTRAPLAVLTTTPPAVVGAPGGEFEFRSRGAALASGSTIEARSDGGGVKTVKVP